MHSRLWSEKLFETIFSCINKNWLDQTTKLKILKYIAALLLSRQNFSWGKWCALIPISDEICIPHCLLQFCLYIKFCWICVRWRSLWGSLSSRCLLARTLFSKLLYPLTNIITLLLIARISTLSIIHNFHSG